MKGSGRMADYISRQAAIDMFQRQAYDDWNQGAGTTWANAFSEAAEMIENLPSADVQPHQLTEEDLTELRHRFGKDVECVVRDMISGKDERWQNG